MAHPNLRVQSCFSSRRFRSASNRNPTLRGFKQSGNLLAHVIKKDRVSIQMGLGSHIHQSPFYIKTLSPKSSPYLSSLPSLEVSNTTTRSPDQFFRIPALNISPSGQKPPKPYLILLVESPNNFGWHSKPFLQLYLR